MKPFSRLVELVNTALAFLRSMLALLVTTLFMILGWLLITLGLGKPALHFAPIWARLCLRILGIRLVVHGREHLPPQGQGFIAAASHSSGLDVLTHPSILPWDTRYVAKRELAGIPLFGGAFERVGNLFVHRGGTEETRAAFNAGIRAQPHRPILIFPEGTRSLDGELRPLKLGFIHIAMASEGMPVVPMVSRGAFELLAKGKKLPRPGVIELFIGEPIPTDAWSKDAIEQQALLVSEAMRALRASGKR